MKFTKKLKTRQQLHEIKYRMQQFQKEHICHFMNIIFYCSHSMYKYVFAVSPLFHVILTFFLHSRMSFYIINIFKEYESDEVYLY